MRSANGCVASIHRRDALRAKERGEALRPAEAADAHLAVRQAGLRSARPAWKHKPRIPGAFVEAAASARASPVSPRMGTVRTRSRPTRDGRLLLIGIGAGDPEYVTQQAIRALNEVDVFVMERARRRMSSSRCGARSASA